jgi:FG-GAP-like repeat/Bacterial Ig-like domain (group 3)/FG-GAP repeat
MLVHASSRIAKGNCASSFVTELCLLKVLLLLGTITATTTSAFSQTPTAISLTVTSSGNSVTSIAAGAMVTLTASVSAGSTVIRQGQVNFCDAGATYCTDSHLLGTAQVTSAGHAQLRLRPAAGNYSYKAAFIATPRTTVSYSASTSGVANLSVSGRVATATTIGQSVSGDYTLTATVVGFTKSPTLSAPGGIVSFLDTTTSNSVLGMGTLSSGSGPAWVNVSNPGVGTLPSGVLSGDFNGDGNLDLAVGINTVSGSGALSASILLGDGHGNFTSAPGSSVAGGGVPAAVADFNQDGIPDLLLSNGSNGSLDVALGNGDGTFAQAAGSPLISNYGVSPVAVADFSGDGIPDIAAAGGYYLIVWLGNGDGSFTQVSLSNSLAAPNLAAMVVGDFNGDGTPDLAGGGETVSVYLGNGDGTFRPGTSFVVTTVHSGIAPNLATGDFNGDGKLDVAVPIPFSGVITILLGNGDGTFQAAASSSTVGQWASRVAGGISMGTAYRTFLSMLKLVSQTSSFF